MRGYQRHFDCSGTSFVKHKTHEFSTGRIAGGILYIVVWVDFVPQNGYNILDILWISLVEYYGKIKTGKIR